LIIFAIIKVYALSDIMKKEEVIDSLANQFNRISEVYTKLYIDELTKVNLSYKNWAERFYGVLRGFITTLPSKPDNNQVYHDVESFLGTIHHLLNDKELIPVFGFQGDLLSAMAANTPLFEQHADIKIPLDKEFYKCTANDNLFQCSLKKSLFFRHWVKNLAYSHSKSHSPSFGDQTFNKNHFIWYYYVVPLLEGVSKLANLYLQEILRGIYNLHLAFENDLNGLYNNTSTEHQTTGNWLNQSVSALQAVITNTVNQVPLSEALEHLYLQSKNNALLFIHYAGTPLLRASKFDEHEYKPLQAKAEAQAEIYTNRWLKAFEGKFNDWKKDCELFIIQNRINSLCNESIQSIDKKLNHTLFPQISETHNNLTGINIRIAHDLRENFLLSKDVVKDLKSKLHIVYKKDIPAITQSFYQLQLNKTLENYYSKAGFIINQLSDSYPVLKELNIDKIPPVTVVDDFEIKEMVKRMFAREFAPGYREFSIKTSQITSRLIEQLNEIGQIIEYNIETTLESLQEEVNGGSVPDPYKILQEGLIRSEKLLKDLLESFSAKTGGITLHLEGLNNSLINEIKQFQNNDNITSLRLQLAKANTISNLEKIKQFFSRLFLKDLPWLFLLFSEKILLVKSGYNRLKKITGLEIKSEDFKRNLSIYLSKAETRIEQLPYLYQRLFRRVPLEDEKLFAFREDKLNEMADYFRHWKIKEFSSVLITGEPGSGRTSFINIARKRILFTNQFYRIRCLRGENPRAGFTSQLKSILGIEKGETLNDLAHEIMLFDKPVIIVVEDLQHIFVKSLEGIRLIEDFLLLMNLTHKKVFWVISCGIYCFNYLNEVIHFKRYFQYIIKLDDLNRQNLAELIMKRHRISGYKLRFEPAGTIGNNRKFKKLGSDTDQQEFMFNWLTDDLFQKTGGNITIAFLLWQLAIKEAGKERLTMSAEIEFTPDLTDLMSDEELFTLASMVVHEGLSAEEHALIFRSDTVNSLHLLSSLHNKGILTKSESGYYRINMLIYKVVIKVLINKNYII